MPDALSEGAGEGLRAFVAGIQRNVEDRRLLAESEPAGGALEPIELDVSTQHSPCKQRRNASGGAAAWQKLLCRHAPAVGATAPADTERPSAFVVKFKGKPGMNAAFEKAFADMQKGVAASEPGNLYYDLYRIDQDPQTYVILEHYKDQEAIKAHGQSAHARKLIATLKDLLDGPPDATQLVLVSSKLHPKP